MPYTQTTESQFITGLAQQLGDSGLVFWSSDELSRALHEAMLLWGALTSYWTSTGSFNTVAATPFYDLSAELSTLRTRAYTFDNIVKEIQQALLEPAAGGVAGGGMVSQFTISRITAALARRRNQWVIDTHIPLTTGSFDMDGAAPGDTLTLNESVAAISRAAWIATATGITNPLRRSDPYAAQAYSPLWDLNPGKPYGYSQAELMPLGLTVVPPPLLTGKVHLVYAPTAALTIAGSTTFAIPDEFAFALKWGTLYDLLSTHNPGYDPIRAKYCLERYNAALQIATLHRSIIRVHIANSLAPLMTLAELDDSKPFWQTGVGVPKKAACVYDLLTFYRVPNAVYNISCTVVRSAPLPAGGSSNINIGREELPYLYDYCRHILSWKMGGAEFLSTLPLYDNFLAGAAKRNTLLETKVRYLTALFGRAEEKDAMVA